MFDAGDSFNASLVAVAVIDPEVLPAWAKSRGIKVPIFSAYILIPSLCKYYILFNHVVFLDVPSVG